MENGGNAKVNAVFEAKLAQSGRTKPTNLADGPTRERYIRDKFERRKFYDPAGFSMQSSSAPAQAPSSGGGSFASPSRPGAPSDAARRRVASRQARMKPSPAAAAAPVTKVAQAPVSAPVEFDLLDFGSAPTTTQATSAAPVGDLFAQQPAVSTSVPANPPSASSSGMPKSAIPPPPKSAPPATASTTLAQELLSNPAPAAKSTTSNDDIMALFGPSKQQQQSQQPFGFGMQGMNSMNTNPMMANGMASQQRNQPNMMAFNNQQNMMSQQQQQQQRMMMMNQQNMMSNNNQMMPNQMMQQQMMQQQMMMQKQMMMQQQQMANQMQGNNSGSMMNNNNMGMFNYGGSSSNNNNMNQAIQGMQNMSMGNTTSGQTNDDGGFGAPMGMGGAPQQQTMKSDAFSSLGGMNAFR